MKALARFALGTLQSEARREPILWGLLAALHELGGTPALFHSSCRLSGSDAAKAVTGCPSRYLDSWAMSRQSASQALVQAVGNNELAIVEGHFSDRNARHPDATARDATGAAPGSSLTTLCEWLDLPRIAIVDVRNLQLCCFPAGAAGFDGLLLDRVADPRDLAYWQTTLESLWRAPVLGWLDEAPKLRALCATLPAGSSPSPELCRSLGHRLLPTLSIERLLGMACRTPPLAVQPELSYLQTTARKFRIAIAYDDAYHCYYPETLDLLEAAGAELCDFSPLKSESLPPDADIIYFGCGHPERYADQLAANHCLKQSLRCFAAAGGRVYGEGAGLGYLCRDILLPDGTSVPMTGLLPATARWLPEAASLEPTEVVFGDSSWLVPQRTALRGYRHAGWQIEPRGPMHSYAVDVGQRLDVLGRNNVIGSRVLINLAANRHLLRRFFEPYPPKFSSARGG